MADKDFKYKNLDEAKKGYGELYGMYLKDKEEGKLDKAELKTAREELLKLKGGIEERTRRETDLRSRLRQPGVTPESRQRANEQFLEQMKVDPTTTFDNRIIQIVKGQGFVRKEELDKETDASKAEEEAYNSFVSSHKDFEDVRPTFTKLWNELPADKRNTSSMELVFKAAKGEMATANPVNLEEEKKKMREELIRELKEKATISGGRKIRTKKEMDEDEKKVSDIMTAHKGLKVMNKK